MKVTGFSRFRAATVLTVMAILSPVATSAAVPDLCDQACLADMERARAATSAYRNADTAVADGFVETGGCISSAEGTAGIRWFNAGRFDEHADVEEPEFLLYTPEGLGHVERRLVGVEYAVPVQRGGVPYVGADPPDPAQVDPPPMLFGRPFEGPMPDDITGTSWRYALRVWIWAPNPNGAFASANPALACGVADLEQHDATFEGCHEVAGTVGVDPEGVRALAGVPDSYRFVGERDGVAQVLISAFFCEAIGVRGVSRPTKFAEITPLVESPYGYEGDFCCSRYLWTVATDNPHFAALYREATGLGIDQVAYDPDIVYRFQPIAGSTDLEYAVRVPSFGYEIRATAGERPPLDLPVSVHIFSDHADLVSHIEFRSDTLRIAPASGELRADPGTAVAEMLGDSSARMTPTVTVSWRFGAATATRTFHEI